MPFQTGTSSDQEDLISDLFTFAAANGWTVDEQDNTNDRGSLHRNSVFVHFSWDGTEGGGPNNIALTQSLAFSGTGIAIDAHTNDSGNGVGTTVLSTERRVSGVGNGPYTYWFFADDVYIHVVLLVSTDIYRHFSFGEINKIGDWTGGEYVAGHVWDLSGVQDDNPTSGEHSLLLDALHTSETGDDEREPATIHVEGLPGQGASDWANVGGGINTTWMTTDGGGNQRTRAVGGFRGGLLLNQFAYLSANLNNGFIPLIPIPICHVNDSTNPDQYTLLGYMPNIRQLQIQHLEPATSLVVGADTWWIFPAVRKRNLQDDAQESRSMGIAYLET
jgi:hypothetical protein